jgi:hypothetical protein
MTQSEQYLGGGPCRLMRRWRGARTVLIEKAFVIWPEDGRT